MKNPRKIRARQLIDNAMQETPEAVSGKRRCGIVLAVFLAARFLCLLAELTGAALGYFTISSFCSLSPSFLRGASILESK